MDYKYKYYKYKHKTEQIGAGFLADLFGPVISKNTKNVTIILTAPHSLCSTGAPFRECDLRAEAVSKMILNNLTNTLLNDAKNIYFFTLFLSDSIRKSNSDLNRTNTRNTKWRTDVHDTIKSCIKTGHKVFVLDIHSFPNNKRSFGGETIPRIVLLDYPANSDAGKYLKQSITVLNGAIDNDIIVSSTDAGAEALLLEFNEDTDYLLNTDIHEFSNLLVKYIKSRL